MSLIDESRKLVVVREVVDATHFTGVWRGQAYECRAIPDTTSLNPGDVAFCHVLPGGTELVVVLPIGDVLWCNDLLNGHYSESVISGPWANYPHALGDSGVGDTVMSGDNRFCFGGVYYSDSIALDWGYYWTRDKGATWQTYKGSYEQDRYPDLDQHGGHCVMIGYSDYATRTVAVDVYDPATNTWSQIFTHAGGGYGGFFVNLFKAAIRGQYAYTVHIWPEKNGALNGRRWNIWKSADYGATFSLVYNAWEQFFSPPGRMGECVVSVAGDILYIPANDMPLLNFTEHDCVYEYDDTTGVLTKYATAVSPTFRLVYQRAADSFLLVGSYDAMNGSRLNKYDKVAHTFAAYDTPYNASPVDAIAYLGNYLVVGGYSGALGYHVQYLDAGLWHEIIPDAASRFVSAKKI